MHVPVTELDSLMPLSELDEGLRAFRGINCMLSLAQQSSQLNRTCDALADIGTAFKKAADAQPGPLKEIEATALQKSRQSAAICLLYTSPSPRDATLSRMPSSA